MQTLANTEQLFKPLFAKNKIIFFAIAQKQHDQAQQGLYTP